MVSQEANVRLDFRDYMTTDIAARWDKINNRTADLGLGVYPLHLTPIEQLHWGTAGLQGEDESKNLWVGDNPYTGFSVALVKYNGFINDDGSFSDKATLGFRPVLMSAYLKGGKIVGEFTHPPACEYHSGFTCSSFDPPCRPQWRRFVRL